MRDLVVKVTCGLEAMERCNQAFTVAATAQLAGARVSVWLTGDAAWLATPGHAETSELAGALPLSELRDTILAGSTLTVCSQCAERRGITADNMLAGVRLAGSVTYVEEVLAEGAQALVY